MGRWKDNVRFAEFAKEDGWIEGGGFIVGR